jgi:starch-binding outer membrane protein, SusD/RagB family
MKNKLILFCTVAMSMFVTSCQEDFLQTESLGALSSFWKTKDDANLGLTAAYDALQANFIIAERNSQNDASMREWECFTDNAMNAFLYQNFNGIKTGALIASDVYAVSNIWRAMYAGVFRANQVIGFVPGISDIDDATKKKMIAQAKFLRAYFYYNLLVGWDDVPLITTIQTIEEASEVTISPAMTVYNQIVQDLIDAATDLPASWPSDYGRATSGAAHAMLARTYLYGFGYLSVSDAAQKAADAAKKVIDSKLYSTFSNYAALFTPANERSAEVIFSIRFSQDLGGNNVQGFSGSFNTNPQSNCQPMPNLANDFYCTDGLPFGTGAGKSPLSNIASPQLNRDPRWDATFVYNTEKWLTNQPAFSSAPAGINTGYCIDKYVVSDNSLTGADNNGQDFYVLRYADVLLMYAEGLIESNGDLVAARAAIDEVRKRVSMPSIAAAEVAKMGIVINTASLRTILRHERRVELAFECSRFPDLKRWGTMQAAYTNSQNDKKGTVLILTGVAYQGKRSIILPIPQREIDVNTNLVQNPAWQ